MTETLTPDIYKAELAYQEIQARRTKDFRELMARFGESLSEPAQQFLKKAHRQCTSYHLLDPYMLGELKEKHPDILQEIKDTYQSFLLEKAGLA